jgi:hypothetical protein
MDERPMDQPERQRDGGPRRGRRLVTALILAGALAALPAGVALAGGSDDSAAGDGSSPGAAPAQQDRGQGDRDDCPERDGRGGHESTLL